MIPLSGDLPKAKGIKSENVESIDVTKGTSTLKRGFAHMLKNGVVMDVTTVEQAQIAEEAGAVSVMVLDKLPSDVRKAGGVTRTASIRIIQDIMDHIYKTPGEAKRASEMLGFGGEIHSHETPQGIIFMPGPTM